MYTLDDTINQLTELAVKFEQPIQVYLENRNLDRAVLIRHVIDLLESNRIKTSTQAIEYIAKKKGITATELINQSMDELKKRLRPCESEEEYEALVKRFNPPL